MRYLVFRSDIAGIGRAICERFVAAGGKVLALDIVSADISGADPVACDLGNPEAIIQLEDDLQAK